MPPKRKQPIVETRENGVQTGPSFPLLLEHAVKVKPVNTLVDPPHDCDISSCPELKVLVSQALNCQFAVPPAMDHLSDETLRRLFVRPNLQTKQLWLLVWVKVNGQHLQIHNECSPMSCFLRGIFNPVIWKQTLGIKSLEVLDDPFDQRLRRHLLDLGLIEHLNMYQHNVQAESVDLEAGEADGGNRATTKGTIKKLGKSEKNVLPLPLAVCITPNQYAQEIVPLAVDVPRATLETISLTFSWGASESKKRMKVNVVHADEDEAPIAMDFDDVFSDDQKDEDTTDTEPSVPPMKVDKRAFTEHATRMVLQSSCRGEDCQPRLNDIQGVMCACIQEAMDLITKWLKRQYPLVFVRGLVQGLAPVSNYVRICASSMSDIIGRSRYRYPSSESLVSGNVVKAFQNLGLPVTHTINRPVNANEDESHLNNAKSNSRNTKTMTLDIRHQLELQLFTMGILRLFAITMKTGGHLIESSSESEEEFHVAQELGDEMVIKEGYFDAQVELDGSNDNENSSEQTEGEYLGIRVRSLHEGFGAGEDAEPSCVDDDESETTRDRKEVQAVMMEREAILPEKAKSNISSFPHFPGPFSDHDVFGSGSRKNGVEVTGNDRVQEVGSIGIHNDIHEETNTMRREASMVRSMQLDPVTDTESRVLSDTTQLHKTNKVSVIEELGSHKLHKYDERIESMEEDAFDFMLSSSNIGEFEETADVKDTFDSGVAGKDTQGRRGRITMHKEHFACSSGGVNQLHLPMTVPLPATLDHIETFDTRNECSVGGDAGARRGEVTNSQDNAIANFEEEAWSISVQTVTPIAHSYHTSNGRMSEISGEKDTQILEQTQLLEENHTDFVESPVNNVSFPVQVSNAHDTTSSNYGNATTSWTVDAMSVCDNNNASFPDDDIPSQSYDFPHQVGISPFPLTPPVDIASTTKSTSKVVPQKRLSSFREQSSDWNMSDW